ncbi:MAG: phage tail tape measure protein [Muribaculaceae bacterium]|nr:phage tail tape measure protein [Muribaculaceae bacterium]
MSTTSSATTTLYVNGRPAEDELRRLRGELDHYKKQLMDIAADPSKGLGSQAWNSTLKKVKATEKELDKVQSNVSSVTQALSRLDKATPEELRKALRQLNKELASIERGSKAWDEQVKKIRAVKDELAKVRAETKEHTSLWERFAKKMFDWGAALQVVFAAITGITMTARRAVEAFAEMDQEMANVRKYTGMTAEQVADLNEEFKKMDTRSSREQLNKLAQDAGRLGKQSKEDVMGFVRAADQINVALDELGEGATLTLSKIAGAFGDEDKYGTEQALLKTGSVINELSQNCRASAPYLAEFAQRLTGAGTTAKMTTPQLMAFGAVLDSNGAQLESSATALGQLIIKLYRDPAKYAEAAGMDVIKFTNLLKTDANEAVLMFLETLHNAGNLDVLAPMLADMGEKGSRSVQTLTMLAGKIDEVRAQQAAANQAFEEGTSITKEFNVQNNTVQAGLEKAKKHFNEMAVQLGEKLAPAMKYAITSTSAMMKVLSGVITFISEHKLLITTLTLAIIGYTAAVKANTIAKASDAVFDKIANALLATRRVVVLAASAAYNALTGNMTRARAATMLLNNTLKLSPWGLAIAGATALVGALIGLLQKMEANRKEAKRLAEEHRKWIKSISDIDEASNRYSSNELTRLKALYKAATDEASAREKRVEAAKQMQNLYPAVFSNFSTEAIMAGQAKDAYDKLTLSIIANARARAAAEKIQENEKKLLDIEDEIRSNEAWAHNAGVRADKARTQQRQNNDRNSSQHAFMPAGVQTHAEQELSETIRDNTKQQQIANDNIARLEAQQRDLNASNERLAKIPGVSELLAGSDTPATPPKVTYTPSGGDEDKKGGGSSKSEDKFKAEKNWREEQIALAKISYLKGETDYEQHQQRLEQIDMQYAEKLMARTDLTEQERLDAQVKFWEAKQKLDKRAQAQTIAEENAAYEDLRMQIQEDYLQNRISKEAYDMQMENIEFAHLRAMTQLTKEGTDERRRAEDAYRQKLVADQQKRQKEYADKEKKHQEQLKQMWDKYFVTDDESKKQQYQTALTLLDEVYKSELAKCAGNNEKKLELDKRYAKARKKLYDEIFKNDKDGQKSWNDWIGEALDKIFGDGTWEKYGDTVKQAFASMTAMMQSFNQMAQAEAEAKIARLEKQYDREISMAEGNNRKVKALERKKEKETARIKAEAQRKEFAQQVMNAISSTALAAINAYASASKIAWWLGPVAAGLALAAGAVQIAAIKKQQEASEAKGFAEGGFTPKGPKDKPVGVVHAGEWVASQRLLANPVARPMIEALDYAQRNNTLGSLRPADVSRSVTAPAVIAGAATDGQNERLMVAVAAALGNYDGTMARLTDRLNEPFVTVNTVTGDMGIKEAQDEYQRLMNNTLPKSKRK